MNVDNGKIRNRTQVRVRYADTDKMGVVYNGMYFTFFEVGRTELMRNFGLPYTEFENAGYILPLVETGARFLSSAFYDDLLEVEAILSLEIKPLVKFEYNILRNNTTIVTGFTVHSFVKADTRKPVKPPRMYVDALEAFRNNLK
jgi:acyl-CoA thioester hydrolase